eukprot:TRINITY_DN12914_c0_g1_i1.p1 TRINITY_DN12914_c0_g1~~TRINITY_DN12914_c0_g1_i1.p1  ORF type:complete len:200 (+),score=17.32 TRINITY_DN12914_c0_g1_i1:157-756(+)
MQRAAYKQIEPQYFSVQNPFLFTENAQIVLMPLPIIPAMSNNNPSLSNKTSPTNSTKRSYIQIHNLLYPQLVPATVVTTPTNFTHAHPVKDQNIQNIQDTTAMEPVQKKMRTSPATETEKNVPPKSKRGRKPLDKQDLICFHCETRVTPEWRRGPSGKHTLCNACGLKYAKILKRPKVKVSPGNISYILNNNNSNVNNK